MKFLSAVCSHNYYLFDNIVWFTQIGILNKFIISKFKWKKLKDIFSLWKTIFEVLISVWVVVRKSEKEQELMRQLIKYRGQMIKSNRHSYVIMRNLILIRRKIRFHQIEVFIYLMRMIMLVFALRLVGHQHLHPIFVSLCGLLQAITVVFKSMKGKKKFYKLTHADIKGEDETMILSQTEFEQRERSLSQLPDGVSPIYPEAVDLDISHEAGVSPLMLGTVVESQDEEVPRNKEVEEKLIDDVYDVNAVKSDYELESLRKGWVLDYMGIMQMR